MYCYSNERDYPYRLKSPHGKVIHAGRKAHVRERVRKIWDSSKRMFVGKETIPAHDVIFPACTSNAKNMVEVSSSEHITCKSCMKAMGIVYKKPGELVRYVLVEKESGYYYKKTSWQNRWVEDVADATLYKLKYAAEKHGTKTFYYLCEDPTIRLSPKEYRELSQEKKRAYMYKTEFDPDRYEIKRVEFNVTNLED